MLKSTLRLALVCALSLMGAACDDAQDAVNGIAGACETRSDCPEGQRCASGVCVSASVRDAGGFVSGDVQLLDPDDGVPLADGGGIPVESDAIPFLDVGMPDATRPPQPPRRDAAVDPPGPMGCDPSLVGDGVCDEPSGTGMCGDGTDTADCGGVPGATCQTGADCTPDERCDQNTGTCVSRYCWKWSRMPDGSGSLSPGSPGLGLRPPGVRGAPSCRPTLCRDRPRSKGIVKSEIRL